MSKHLQTYKEIIAAFDSRNFDRFLDFVTDVLMITMTTFILVSINPWLALVTLLPLPIIAWLI